MTVYLFLSPYSSPFCNFLQDSFDPFFGVSLIYMTKKVFYPLPETLPSGLHSFQKWKPFIVSSQLGGSLSLDSQLQ